jgi:hypothetical protein
MAFLPSKSFLSYQDENKYNENVKKFGITLTLFCLVLFQSCKIAGSKRPTETPNETTVMNYFSSEQYKFETPGYQAGEVFSDALSSLYGIALVADQSASFSNLVSPPFGCAFGTSAGLNFEPKRVVDIGKFRLSGFGLNEVEIPKDKESVSQSIYGSLSRGDYELKNDGVNGNLAFRQSFKVPASGNQIRVYTGTRASQTLATPNIPQPEDPNYTVVVDKTEGLTIDFEPPQDANFVRIQISDGTSKPESNVICYGPLDKPINIEKGRLNYFRSTEDGVLYIDFVHVSLRTDIEKIKESVVVSHSRQVHGLVDFYLENVKQTVRFGVLKFE